MAAGRFPAFLQALERLIHQFADADARRRVMMQALLHEGRQRLVAFLQRGEQYVYS